MEWFLTELRTASKGTSRACLTMPNPCVVSWSKKGLFSFSGLPIQYVCHAKKIGWWEWKYSLQSRVRESIRGQALFKVTGLDLKHTLKEKLRYAVRFFSFFFLFFAKMWCDSHSSLNITFFKKGLAQKKMFKLSLCNFKELHLWSRKKKVVQWDEVGSFNVISHNDSAGNSLTAQIKSSINLHPKIQLCFSCPVSLYIYVYI